jgi:uncharacterized protein DUF5615
LLADEMLSGAIAEQVRPPFRRHRSSRSDGFCVEPDDGLLENAAERGRILVTANTADFAATANDLQAVVATTASSTQPTGSSRNANRSSAH